MSASVPNGPLPDSTADSFDNTRPGFGEASGSRDQEVVGDRIDVGDRMRILVAGRASAGKTTLLRRVCGASYQSGSNDIGIELSHPLFIFHDSAGFESNRGAKISLVEVFVSTRAAANKISERLHAIWYCIPTDTYRFLSAGDEHFFKENVARDVPVIVVFTRYRGLVTFAYGELRATLGRVESKEKRFDKAQEMLRSRYIEPLEAMPFPPHAFVRLGDLLDDDTSFEELIETTLRLLSGDTLKPMILSVRQTNLDLCMERAVYEGLDAKDLAALLSHVLPHYPHIWRDEKYDDKIDLTNEIAQPHPILLSQNILACSSTISVRITATNTWTHTKRAEIVAAVCICIEQTFMQASATTTAFPTAFSTALDAYVAPDSALRISVNKEIAKFSPQDYREVSDPASDQATRKAVSKLVDIIKTHRLRLADG